MNKYVKHRLYDGNNCDLGFQITYISEKRGKVKKDKYCKNVVIDDYILMEDCKSFYNERVDNYQQMVSDFVYFSPCIRTIYFPPLILKKNDDILFCHVKMDEIGMYRFLKFNFPILFNDICFSKYVGDIEHFISGEITSKKGFKFYINNRQKKFNNLKEAISYYLKKCKITKSLSSIDNMVALTDNFEQVMIKYLKRNSLKTNLFVRNINNDRFPNLHGVYLSEYGNFVYVIQNCVNFCKEYENIIPTLENSYDFLKQYILLNEFLIYKYSHYCTYSVKIKNLKKDYMEICFFKSFRDSLKNKSMGSVSFIIKEFERTCVGINFNKRANVVKKQIINELRKRNIDFSSFVSETVAKTTAEIYDKTLDRFN